MKFPAGREEREKHSLLAEGGEIWPGRRILAEEERSGRTSAEELRSDSRLRPAGRRPKSPPPGVQGAGRLGTNKGKLMISKLLRGIATQEAPGSPLPGGLTLWAQKKTDCCFEAPEERSDSRLMPAGRRPKKSPSGCAGGWKIWYKQIRLAICQPYLFVPKAGLEPARL